MKPRKPGARRRAASVAGAPTPEGFVIFAAGRFLRVRLSPIDHLRWDPAAGKLVKRDER